MKPVIITIGISASGKTTWAEQHVCFMDQKGKNWININRDDIRKIIFSEKTGSNNFKWFLWKKNWEKEAYSRWVDALNYAVEEPYIDGIIISDTNLNPKTRQFLIDKFKKEDGFSVEFKLFPISFEEAIKRNFERENPVQDSIIAEQIEKYWDQFGEKYIPNKLLPKAVIVDVDGTLAHKNDRGPFDWSRVGEDIPDQFIIDIVRGLKIQSHYEIIVVSGRDGVCKEETMNWLKAFLKIPFELFMRKEYDNRKDCIVKKEIFDNEISKKYNVVGVIDDRPQVVRMWNSLGIKTLACGFQNKDF